MTDDDATAPATMVRYRIIMISILMAFGLYLTRVAPGEIVKTDSFQDDTALNQHPATRFQLELTDSGDTTKPLRLLVCSLTGRPESDADTLKLTYPQVLKDNLTRAEATVLLSKVENVGGSGRIRISKQQIGSILGAFFFTYALLQVPAGWIGDRFGPRRALSVYILSWSALTAISGLMVSLPGLLFARLGYGVCQAGAYPASNAIVRRWFPLSLRGRASSLISFGGRLGGTLAPLLTTLLIFWLGGWRATLWAYGAFGVLVAIGYWVIVRDRPSQHSQCNPAELELIGMPPDGPTFGLRELARVVLACATNRSLWLNSLGQFCVNVGWAFLVTWLPTYLKESKGVPSTQGALMVTIVLSTGMIGQLIGGWATDLSVRKLGLRIGRVLPISLASAMAGLAYMSCLLFDNVWAIVACCALVSLMTDVGNPSIWAFMQDIGGRSTATVFGWANMWGNFGAAFSASMVPALMTWGSQHGSGQSLVFIACGSAFFIAGIAAMGMDATKPM